MAWCVGLRGESSPVHLMPERGDLAYPVMPGAACHDADQHPRLRLEEVQHLNAAELATQHDPARTIDPVHLEEVLGDVEADGHRDALSGSLHGGRLFRSMPSTAPSLAHDAA